MGNIINNGLPGTKSQQIFISGWALKENEKTCQRGSVKRITLQMYKELLKRVELGKIEENNVPKVSTITNWISTFSRKWKKAMVLRSLEENMDSENS
ncbi:hypothetical protein GLOIN_2v1790442 [Rhizophagus clarus]|uniref:Uncharacterized protein n=1 Tax=Rhizophagus clarus TaxID=94130 RepID=A0A8H3R461_9GLOM|nr:hypothetical protein GLOIN_2v1790442 [Rhizophagus clarus]